MKPQAGEIIIPLHNFTMDSEELALAKGTKIYRRSDERPTVHDFLSSFHIGTVSDLHGHWTLCFEHALPFYNN